MWGRCGYRKTGTECGHRNAPGLPLAPEALFLYGGTSQGDKPTLGGCSPSQAARPALFHWPVCLRPLRQCGRILQPAGDSRALSRVGLPWATFLQT